MSSQNPKAIPIPTQVEINRFWKYVDKSTGLGPQGDCWEWISTKSKRGYGKFSFHSYNYRAHRFAYRIAYGEDPLEYHVCHTCDNPPCVNPAHLWKGTDIENTQDSCAKGRRAVGDRNGSRLYPERLPRGDGHFRRKHPEKVARGEANHRSKLTANIVQELRHRYQQGLLPSCQYKEVAQKLGITDANIRAIVKNLTWRHLL